MKNLKTQRDSTLLEIRIVLAIIGILVALIVTKLGAAMGIPPVYGWSALGILFLMVVATNFIGGGSGRGRRRGRRGGGSGGYSDFSDFSDNCGGD